MKQSIETGAVIGLFLLWMCSTAAAASRSSASFFIPADTFNGASGGASSSSASFDASLSLDQPGPIGIQSSSSFQVPYGYQATIEDGPGAEPDFDMDGIPDSIDPDDDNDGLTDVEEGLAGTSPFNPDSDNDSHSDFVEVKITETDPNSSTNFLKMVHIRLGLGPGELEIQWESIPGKTNYYLEHRSSLSGASIWTNVAGPLTGTGTVTSIVDTNEASPFFYRINVPYAP